MRRKCNCPELVPTRNQNSLASSGLNTFAINVLVNGDTMAALFIVEVTFFSCSSYFKSNPLKQKLANNLNKMLTLGVRAR